MACIAITICLERLFKELGHYFVLQGDPGPQGLQGEQGGAGLDVRIAINMGWK